MRPSLFFSAFSVAFSAVNAVVFSERAITTASQVCIADLQSLGEQMAIIANAFHSTNITDSGLSGAYAIHVKEQELEKRLILAGTDCCAIPSIVSSEEAEAMLSIVGAFTTRTPSALEEIATKKLEFDAILSTAIVKNDISKLYNQTEVLTTCLLAKTPATPPNYLESAKKYVGILKSQFATVKTAYGIK